MMISSFKYHKLQDNLGPYCVLPPILLPQAGLEFSPFDYFRLKW